MKNSDKALRNSDDPTRRGRFRARLTRLSGLSLGAMAIVLLCIMVLVTCVDVVGRYVFAAPLPGAHEAIVVAMGLMIYLGMPLVSAADEHLTVNIADRVLGPRGRRGQKLVIDTVAALAFVVFAFLLWSHGVGLQEDMVASDDLEIEQAPLAFLMAAMCFFTILVFAVRVRRGLTGRDRDRSSPTGQPGRE